MEANRFMGLKFLGFFFLGVSLGFWVANIGLWGWNFWVVVSGFGV